MYKASVIEYKKVVMLIILILKNFCLQRTKLTEMYTKKTSLTFLYMYNE